jgi:hypothetical protein
VTEEFPRIPFKDPRRVAGWVPLAGTIMLAIALSYFMDEAKGWVTACATGALSTLIQFAWPMRKVVWFWLVVAAFAAAHIWAVLYFDWSWVVAEHSGVKLLGTLMALDFGGMVALIYGIYRLRYGAPAKSVEESIDDLPRYSDRDINL